MWCGFFCHCDVSFNILQTACNLGAGRRVAKAASAVYCNCKVDSSAIMGLCSTMTRCQGGLSGNSHIVAPFVCIRAQQRAQACRQQQHCPARGQARLYAFAGGMEDLDGGDQLASEFAAHVNQLALKAPLQHRRPSPLEPPTAAVAAQMDALQINDWPEPDAGVLTALAFAKPYRCEDLVTAAPTQGGLDVSLVPLPAPRFTGRGNSSSRKTTSSSSSNSTGSSSSGDSNHGSSSGSLSSGDAQTLVRSWSAREAWLTPKEFAAELHSSTYAPLLGCDRWRACSPMVFPPTRVGHRAVQAVEVLASSSTRPAGPHGPSSGSSSDGSTGEASLQRYTYTFVLERITSGPYTNTWLTVGVRPGNYAV